MSLMQKVVIVLMIVVCAFVNAAALPVNSIEYLEKVSLQVLDDTANGQQAPFILILAEQADVEKAARFVQHIQKAEAVFTVLQQTAQQSQPAVTKELDRAGVTYSTFTLVNAIRVYGDRTLVFQMASRKDISAIVPDHAFRAALEEPDNFLPVTAAPSAVEWNIQKVNADDLWDLGITGAGLVYGNADTGIDWTHPALQNHYRGWSEMGANHNYYWWDAAHEDLSGDSANDCGFSSPVPCDDYGHGTHTTGIGVGGEGSNQVGVAPGAKWIGCRNMEDGYGSPSTYLECLDFMLAPWDLNHENPRPDLHADVIGNSYTCPVSEGCGDKHILQTAVNNLRAAGIFMSVSAGNEGSNCSTIVDPPAIEDGVITIGATTSTDVIASLSSRGPITVDGSNLRKPDLVAPGINVRSTYPGGVYASMSGTSMASPHVAGVVALLWQRFPVLKGNIDATESILENSALHLTSSQCGDGSSDVPNNVYGYGRVDALAAYLAATQLPVIYFPLLMR